MKLNPAVAMVLTGDFFLIILNVSYINMLLFI